MHVLTAADTPTVVVNVPNTGTTALITAVVVGASAVLVQVLIRRWKKTDDTAAADRAYADLRKQERERRSDAAAETILTAADLGQPYQPADPDEERISEVRKVWARESVHLLNPDARVRVEDASLLLYWCDHSPWASESSWQIALSALSDVQVALGAVVRGEPLPERVQQVTRLREALQDYLDEMAEAYEQERQAREAEHMPGVPDDDDWPESGWDQEVMADDEDQRAV